MITFMLIANDPELAVFAESCGVGRIFVDIERRGKLIRQQGMDTWISQHEISDVPKIKSVLTHAELLVRVNAFYNRTFKEVEQAVEGGADVLMLPMFRHVDEVADFVDLVDGRAKVIPLVETVDAVKALPEVVKLQGVDEIYIGLNDLHLDMQLDFMLQPLADGLVDDMAKTIRDAGLPFGFGGIARLGEGVVSGELILAEHVRLGSECVILSRTFHRKSEGLDDMQANLNLKFELAKLLSEGKRLLNCSKEELDDYHAQVQMRVGEYLKNR